MAAAGEFNGWSTTPNMSLFDDNQWQATALLSDDDTVEFKFAANGSWGVNWGISGQSVFDPPLAALASSGGGNIALSNALTAPYRFRFNDSSGLFLVTDLSDIPAEANLLSNPGFETAGWSADTAYGWSYGNPGPLGGSWGGARRSSGGPRSGSWDGEIPGASDPDYGGWWQDVAAEPGLTYRASAWFWTQTSPSVWTAQIQTLKIVFYSFDYEALGEISTNVPNAGQTWTRVAVEGAAPDGTAWARWNFEVSDAGTGGALRVDDTDLRVVAQRSEGFNDWAAPWDDCYSRGGWQLCEGLVTTTNARSSRAASLAPPSAGSTNYVRSPALTNGLGALTFWYRHGTTSTNDEPETSVAFRVLKSTNGIDWVSIGNVTNIRSLLYTRYTQFLYDPAYRYLCIEHAEGEDRLLIDDIVIEEPQAAQGYQDFNTWPSSGATPGCHTNEGWTVCTGAVSSVNAYEGKSARLLGHASYSNRLISPLLTEGHGRVGFYYARGTNGLDPAALALQSSPDGTTWTDLAEITNIASTAYNYYDAYFYNTNAVYLRVLNLYRPRPAGGDVVLIDEHFDNGSVAPPNWVFSGSLAAYTGSGYYGEDPPSLKFDGVTEYIITPTLSQPTNMAFWYRGSGSNGTNCTIQISGRESGGDYELIYTNLLPASGTITNIPIPTDIVNIKVGWLRPGNSGYMALDDVCILGADVGPQPPQDLMIDQMFVQPAEQYRSQSFDQWPKQSYEDSEFQGWSVHEALIDDTYALAGQAARIKNNDAYIRTPPIEDGLGTFSFWYRRYSYSGSDPTYAVQISSNATSWTTLTNLTITSTNYAPFSLYLYDLTNRYLQVVRTSGNANSSIAVFDSFNVGVPSPPADLASFTGGHLPEAPYTNDAVSLWAKVVPWRGALNVTVTGYYRIGESGPYTALPLQALNLVNYESIDSIPPVGPGTSVYYYLRADFQGAGSDRTSPRYYPEGGITNPLSYGIPRNRPGRVWINEVKYGDYYNDWGVWWGVTSVVPSYIELAGYEGTDISNWHIEVVKSAGVVGTYAITNHSVLGNEDGGLGFWVLAYSNMYDQADPFYVVTNRVAMRQDQALTNFLWDTPLGIRLLDEMGGEVQALCFGGALAGFTTLDMYDDDYFPATSGVSLVHGGTNYAQFSWLEAVAITPGEINVGQSFTLLSVTAEVASVWETNAVPVYYRVERNGTNGDLNVGYTVSGTATAGVQYVAMSGLLTITNGADYGRIALQPIHDPATNGDLTVTIALAASTNDMYGLVGGASTATITILDYELNRPPFVYAGPDQTVSILYGATLPGVVYDDGRPSGYLNVSWSQVSGRGTVTFTNSQTAHTRATFSQIGTYVLQLTATDGELMAYDQVTITVVQSAPALTNFVVAANGYAWSLHFDQAMDSGTAGIATNYTLTPALTVSTAEVDEADASVVRLLTEQVAYPRKTYTVTVAHAQSTAGYAVTNGTKATTVMENLLYDGSFHTTASILRTTGTWGLTNATRWGAHPNWAPMDMEYIETSNSYSWHTFAQGVSNAPAGQYRFTFRYQLKPPLFNLSYWVLGFTNESPSIDLSQNPSNIAQAAKLVGQGLTWPSTNWTEASYLFITTQAYRYVAVAFGAKVNQNIVRIDDLVLTAVNDPPVVDAGPNLTNGLYQPLTLSGSVSDDGFPPDGELTILWSQVSGPGTALFGVSNSPSTPVSFTREGAYTLRLSANDGEKTASDDVTVWVDGSPPVAREARPLGAGATVMVLFDSQLLASSATQTANYALSGGLSINGCRLAGNEDRVLLSLSGVMTEGMDYTLTLTDIADPYGNTLVSTQLVFNYAFPVPKQGLAMWFTAGAGLVQSGSQVTTWQDQSGKGHNASQGTASRQPTFLTNSVNGMPALRFLNTSGNNGVASTNYLDFNCPISGLTNLTLVVVSSSREGLGDTDINRCSTFSWRESGPYGSVRMSPHQPNLSVTFGQGNYGTHRFIERVRAASIDTNWTWTLAQKDGRTERVFVNGEQLGADNIRDAAASYAIASTSNDGYIGGDSNLKLLDCDIAEILVYTNLLSPADFASLSNYLTRAYEPDTEPPTMPGNLHVATNSDVEAALAWEASTDNRGVSGYEISLGDTPVGVTEAVAYTNTGLTPARIYTSRVRAYDASWNYSDYAVVVFTTKTAIVDAPILSPMGGLFTNSITVTLGNPNGEGTIYYTTDNTEPTTNATAYSGALTFTDSTILRARVIYANGLQSAEAEGYYSEGMPADGLVMWLKADAGVALSGASVMTWYDQSGHGHHASQGTSSRRPTLVTNALNGMPYVRFLNTSGDNGVASTNFLNFSCPISGLSNLTLVTVSSARWGYGEVSRNTCSTFAWKEAGGYGSVRMSPHQDNVSVTFGQGNNCSARFILRNRPEDIGTNWTWTLAQKAGRIEKVYVNNEQLGPDNIRDEKASYVIASTSNDGYIGADSNLKLLDCDIAEIWVYTNVLTDLQRQDLKTYIEDRYGLSTNEAPRVMFKINSFVGATSTVPSAGTYYYTPTTLVQCAAAEYFNKQTTQWVNDGWIGSGDLGGSGSGTNVEFVITNDTTITWGWQRYAYWLGTETGPGGRMAVTSKWIRINAYTNVTAIPDPGYAFAGWSGDTGGCAWVDNTITLHMTNFSRNLSAAFVYAPSSTWLYAFAETNGTIAPSGTVTVMIGSSTSFVATANPYYRIAELRTNGSPIAAAAGRPCYTAVWPNVFVPGTITVSFATAYATNGVPEWWLAQYYPGTNDFDNAAVSDTDEDRMRAWEEYVANTDPTDAQSNLAVTNLPRAGAGRVIQWVSRPERYYTVLFSTNLKQDFTGLPAATNLPYPQPSYTDTTHDAEGMIFYRVDVSR